MSRRRQWRSVSIRMMKPALETVAGQFEHSVPNRSCSLVNKFQNLIKLCGKEIKTCQDTSIRTKIVSLTMHRVNIYVYLVIYELNFAYRWTPTVSWLPYNWRYL
jgi:hypothetical protein